MIEILNNPIVQSLLVRVFYDVSKGALKSALSTERNIITESINETTIYFADEEIALLPDYFNNMLVDDDVQQELKCFANGERDISIDVLAKSLTKNGFYYPTAQDKKSKSIVQYFLKCIGTKFLDDPTSASSYLYAIIKIQEKNQTDYSKAIVTNIAELQNSLTSKLNEIMKSQKLLESTVPLIEEIHKGMKSISSAPGAFSSSESKKWPDELQSAIKLHNEGRVILARNEYLRILSKKPIDIEELWKLNSNIGKTYINSGEESKGVPYFEKAYHYFAEEEKGLLQLVYARLLDGNNPEGIKIVEKILAINPKCTDAAVLGANMWVRLNRPEKAKELFTDEILKDPISLNTYGWVLKNLGLFDEAEKYIRIVIEKERRPEDLTEMAICILEPIAKRAKTENPSFKGINEENKNKLKECIALFTEALDSYKMKEFRLQEAQTFLNRSVAYALMGETAESYHDCVEAERLGLKDPILSRNKGIDLMRMDKAEEAIVEFEKAVEGKDSESILFLINAYMMADRFADAKKYILKNVSYPTLSITEENIGLYAFLSDIFERELDSSEADRILSAFESPFEDNAEVIIRRAKNKLKHEGSGQAIKILKEALNKQVKKRAIIEITLADFYFASKMWEEAFTLYDDYAGEDEYDLPTERCIICLHNLGQNKKCLELCNKVISRGITPKVVKEVEARIWSISENFIRAGQLFKELAVSYRKPEDYFYWAECEFRLGHLEEAKRILDVSYTQYKDQPEILASISTAYVSFGETQQAIELAYAAIKASPENANVVENYFKVFMHHTQLHPEENAVSNEQRDLFKDVMEHYEDRFPNRIGLKKIAIPKPSGEMKYDDFKMMFKKYLPDQQGIQTIETFYSDHHLPISIFSKLINRNVIEVWNTISNSSNKKIWAYNPVNFPRERGAVSSPKIIVEPIALLSLYAIGCHKLLEKIYTQTYYPQGFFDMLQIEITNNNVFHKDGKSIVGIVKDELFFQKIDVKTMQEEQKKLIELRDFTIDRVIGYAIRDKDKDEKNLPLPVQNYSIQAVEQAMSQNIPLLCDEAVLQSIVGEKYLFRTVSTYTFLRHCLIKGALKEDKYINSILKLVELNYHYVPIDAKILLTGIQREQFKINDNSLRIFNSISDSGTDPILDAKVIAEFLVRLYSEPILDVTKNHWFNYALDCLPRTRQNMTVLIKKISIHVDQTLENRSLQKNEILKWIRTGLSLWAQLKGVPYYD